MAVMTQAAADHAPPPAALIAALARMGLMRAGESARVTPLPGGVSSDIWRVDLGHGAVCVKRALARLKVAADWRAPVERNAYEVAWMDTAGRIAPEAVPRLCGHDRAAGLFAMEYLDPAVHPPWKTQLRDGIADPATARAVADRLVRIHAATAGDPVVAARFASDEIFHAIRLEPYLVATARAHPDRAATLLDLVDTTARTKGALVHGDVSPKNILIGPNGPIFLDAECAWYGDPAFDLAFCLNHLLLKCLWTPPAAGAFLACFEALAATYRAGVDWEPPAALEARTARLLPGLFLGRVDGKSPVEYLAAEADKDRVRRVARALLANPPDRLAQVRGAWERELRV
jgi:aminoglycoside phosphotransferase (APT) family kinase protein